MIQKPWRGFYAALVCGWERAGGTWLVGAGEGQCGTCPVQSMGHLLRGVRREQWSMPHSGRQPPRSQGARAGGRLIKDESLPISSTAPVTSHLVGRPRRWPCSFFSSSTLRRHFRHAAAAAPPIGGLHLDLGLFFVFL